MSAATAGDAYLPLKHLAAYAGLSVRTLRGYLSQRARPLPHYRIGGKVLVKRSEYDSWAAGFRVAPGSAEGMGSLVDEVIAGLRV